jgi:hypothetical protein
MQTLFHIDGGGTLDSLAPLLGMDAQIARDSNGAYWVRLETNQAAQLERLACVGAGRLMIENDRWLVRPGERIAIAKLPADLSWEPLDDSLELQLPPAGFAAPRDALQRQPLRLIRGGRPLQPTAMLASLVDFHRWVDTASEIRLRRLKWVQRAGEVLVMGEPLPPIAADYFIRTDHVLVPAGYVWTPAVTAADVKAVFAIEQDQWLVWESNQSWDAVDEDAWMAVRRASVRQAIARQADALRAAPAAGADAADKENL